MRVDGFVSYYKIKAANAAIDTQDQVIPANKTVVLKMIDFSAPAGKNCGVRIKMGSNILSMAQSDKVVIIPPGQTISNATITIELDNTQNASAAQLGATVYYEML